MKYQILFSRKNKKNVINLSAAELAQGVLKMKVCPYYMHVNILLYFSSIIEKAKRTVW